MTQLSSTDMVEKYLNSVEVSQEEEIVSPKKVKILPFFFLINNSFRLEKRKKE
jgi:hypothetical protein